MAKTRTTKEQALEAPTVDQSDPLAAKAAEQIARMHAARASGKPRARVGHIENGEPGWRYYWFSVRSSIGDRKALGDGVLASERQMLADLDYEPVNGPMYDGDPRLEYVPGVPGAEIWRVPRATWQERRRMRTEDLHTSDDQTARAWRETQAARQAPRGSGFLPADVLERMRAEKSGR